MSGASDEYDDGDVDGLVDKMEQAFGIWGGGDTMRVTARIEWNNEENRRSHRTTSIGGMDLGPVAYATSVAVTARTEATNARRRHGPTSWAAQFKSLSGSKAGYAAMRAAGVNASAETQKRWLAGTQAPGRDNQRALAEANRQVYAQRADAARQRYLRAAHAAADALTEAVQEVTGDDVRFRDISDLDFG